MPEQASRRGPGITEADFTAPFSTPIYPLGNGGINLAAAVDAVEVGQFTRLTNANWALGEPRALTGRPGQLSAVTLPGATNNHSIVRLDDLPADTRTYLWGADGALYLGDTGAAAASIATGFSGDPLTFQPGHPPLSGAPWAYVADRDKMVKVRFDGLVLPIGLPAPSAVTTAALDAEQKTNIAVGAETWTANPGQDYSTPPLVAAAGQTQTDPAEGTTFTTDPGTDVLTAGNGYWSFWGAPITLNLDLVGALPATDDDLMHMLFKLGNPSLIAEVRVYLVCSATFSPSVLPGSSVDAGGMATDANTEFYLKAFRPDDFAGMVQTYQSQVNAAEVARINAIRQQAQADLATAHGFTKRILRHTVQSANAQLAAAQRDPARNTSVQAGGASDQYTNFGTVGVPLRRGEWKRFGSSTDRGWSTITGLVVYIQTLPNAQAANPLNLLVFCTLLEWYLTGGSGPDVSEPDAQSYDYRSTGYDPRTGVEGNPSDIMAEANWAVPLRRTVLVTPQASGDSAVRQRIYRRGGSLTDNWYFCGVNDADGGVFADTLSDFAIAEAGTVEIDHYQPVPTVDASGNTVLAQPLPVLFGPYNGQFLGLGDPYRPGYVYGSLPNQPDIWPPDLVTEVCPPSEQLMNGGMYGGNAYVFSRLAGYAIYGSISDTNGLTAAPTMCKHGLAGRWAFTQGAGAIWLGSTDGIYKTSGGAEELVSAALYPLFHGQSMNGYAPLAKTADGSRVLNEAAYRLAEFNNELWVTFEDTNGDRPVWILQILTGRWRHYDFAREVSALYPDDGRLLLGGATSGAAYTHAGTDDDGAAIAGTVRTASWDWTRPREEKLLGDQILDVDPASEDLTWINYLNAETVTNPTQTIAGFSGRARVILDSFGASGNGPQRARSLAVQVGWSTTGTPPTLYYLGTSITAQPDITLNRVTNWDDGGHPDQKWLMGVTFDCDTGGSDRLVLIEADYQGVTTTVATLTVNTDGRHKVAFSWPGAPCNQFRVRPDADCAPWILYRADWNFQPEPPNIATWDTYFENKWDQYYTGLDLYCDTGGQPKTIVVSVDGVVLSDPATALPYWTITTNGRQVVHLTLPWGRGHVFRFIATDANPGLLYEHRWHLVEEPTEQANWVQPFTILGTQADKYLKAIIFEIDTFGQTKTVQIQADETTVLETVSVTANGRQVVQVAIPQVLGRVFRFFPVDTHPSRLYSLRPVFDEEPFALTRWETQQINHGHAAFQTLIEAQVTLKSVGVVTLTVSTYVNQTGTVAVDTYTLPSTAGDKLTRFVPFVARKGILFKYVLTADAPFWLYREESHVVGELWVTGETFLAHVFGNSDEDATRGMVNSTLAAARSGGGASDG